MARTPWYVRRALGLLEEEGAEFPPAGKKEVCTWELRCRVCGESVMGESKSMKELVRKAVNHTLKEHPWLFFIDPGSVEEWGENPYNLVEAYLAYIKKKVPPRSEMAKDLADVEVRVRGDSPDDPGVKNSVLVVILDNVTYLAHSPNERGTRYGSIEVYRGRYGYRRALLRAMELAFIEGNYSFVRVVGVISPEKLPETIKEMGLAKEVLAKRLKDIARDNPLLYNRIIVEYVDDALQEFWDKYGKSIAEKFPGIEMRDLYLAFGSRISIGRPDIWARAYEFRLEGWEEFPYYLWKSYIRHKRPLRRFTVPWIGTKKGFRHPAMLAPRSMPVGVDLRTNEPIQWLNLSDWILEGEMFRMLIDYPKVVVCKMPGCGTAIGCISYATARKWMWKHFVDHHLLSLLAKKLNIPEKYLKRILDGAEYLLRVGKSYRGKYARALSTLANLARRYQNALNEGIYYEAEEILEQARPYAYMLFRKDPEEVLADPDKVDRARRAFENITVTSLLQMALEYARAKSRKDEEAVRRILDRVAPIAEVAFGEPPEDVIGKIVDLVEALKASGKWSEAYLKEGRVYDVVRSVELILKWVDEEINRYASEFYHYFDIIIPDAYPDDFLINFLPEASGTNARAMLLELISKSEQIASQKRQLESRIAELREEMAKVPENSLEYRKLRDRYLKYHLDLRRCNSILGKLMRKIRLTTAEFESAYLQYLKTLRAKKERELEEITREYEELRRVVEEEKLSIKYSEIVSEIARLNNRFLELSNAIGTLEYRLRRARSPEEARAYEEELRKLRREASEVSARIARLEAVEDELWKNLFQFYQYEAWKKNLEELIAAIDWQMGRTESLIRLLRKEWGKGA